MPQGNGFIMKEEKTGTRQVPPCLPRVDFSGFILSLYSSGLVQLGKMPDPVSGIHKTDLSMAKHTIDILCMLADKTRNNLTGEEENLLKSLLTEIRMIYVEVTG
jgi:hypothetical protein